MQFSEHALIRCQQRNISHSLVELAMFEHDRETAVGNGRYSFWTSRRHIKKLVRDGVLEKLYARQLEKLVLLVEPKADIIITVLKTYGTKKEKPYYKGVKKRKAKHKPIRKRYR